MAADNKTDTLPTDKSYGFSTAWDYKGSYVDALNGSAAGGEGLERFSQYSATPDTTALYAGPARFTGLGGDVALLTPIGLVDGISYTENPQLQRLFEIGSNRSFFTRGKTFSSISFSKLLADQKNILAALMQNAYVNGGAVNTNSPAGATAASDVMMNLDSEYFGTPFGLMLIFKTRGGNGGDGKILSAIYLESCYFANYQFNISSGAPVISEGVAIEFDRSVPISLV